MQATFDNCNNFNTKLQDTLKGLINANADRKSEIDSLRNDHEDLKKVLSIFNPKIQIFQMQYICSTLVFHSPDFFYIQAHESFQTSAERENDLRKNEIKSLEERCQKDNQVIRSFYYQRLLVPRLFSSYRWLLCTYIFFLYIKGPHHRYRQT